MGLPSSKVEVDSTGRQKQEPPPGSYAAMALEQQREQAAQSRMPPTQESQQPVEPPQEPPAPEDSQRPEGQQQVQQNGPQRVEKRFAELAAARRDAERKAQDAEARLAARDAELEQVRSERQQLAAERQRLLESNLEQLDPEQRVTVLAEARTRELMAEQEKRITQRFEAPLQEMRDERRHRDLMKIADRYPAFDAEVHGPLIDAYQSRNHASTVEQAFRAIAEDHELTTSPVQPRKQVPPTVQPRSTRGSSGYVPPPSKTEEDAQRQLSEEVREIGKLNSSHDPADRRKARDLMDANLKKRFEGRFQQ